MSVYASKEIPFRKEWIVNDKHLLLSNTGWRYRVSDFRKTKDGSRSLSARQKYQISYSITPYDTCSNFL